MASLINVMWPFFSAPLLSLWPDMLPLWETAPSTSSSSSSPTASSQTWHKRKSLLLMWVFPPTLMRDITFELKLFINLPWTQTTTASFPQPSNIWNSFSQPTLTHQHKGSVHSYVDTHRTKSHQAKAQKTHSKPTQYELLDHLHLENSSFIISGTDSGHMLLQTQIQVDAHFPHKREVTIPLL